MTKGPNRHSTCCLSAMGRWFWQFAAAFCVTRMTPRTHFRVYRKGRSPRSAKPECFGRIGIVSIELDSAMAEVIASEGKMINEGDCVSTQMTRLSVDQ